MAEQVGESELAPQRLQHLRHRACAHEQRQSKFRQAVLQLGHAIEQEADMARVALRARQPLRLDHHKTHRAFEAHRLCQGGVIAHTQIALEPDQRRRACHVADAALRDIRSTTFHCQRSPRSR